MRVGLFSEAYDPVVNGVTTSVKLLAAQLAGAGHSPVVVAPRYGGHRDEPCDWEVRRLPSFRTWMNPNYPFAYPPLGPSPAALRNVRLDLIHTQQPFGMGLHGRRLARLWRVPLVSTFHTLYHQYTHYFPLMPGGALRRVLTRHLHRYYTECDAVIVPSRAAGDQLLAIGVPEERLVVVPTGVPAAPTVLPAAIAEARRRLRLDESRPVALFVGRLAREKNLELLLDAFAPMAGRAILLLVGSGPHKPALEQHIRQLGIEEWVRLPGFLARGELAPIYELASVFAFPSGSETQGVVLSEAQSHGLPCVVVGAGGGPEFVRDGVDALVTPASVEPFGQALASLLLESERRRRFGQAARESPLRPTPEGMARRIIETYEQASRRERATTEGSNSEWQA